MVDFREGDERRLQRARTFDEIAELYDRARPGYPEQLFDSLFELAGFEPAGAQVVEIGCGTGQASVSLARRGCRLTCVDMGANLARIARRNLAPFPNATVVNARFEDWQADEPVDMVFAATSWHWMDPEVRYRRAAELLPPGGVLAFTTGGHAFPPDYDRFFEQIQDCYRAIGEARIQFPPPGPETMSDARQEIERSGYFEDVRVARLLWTREFTADEHVNLMSTASDHRLMEPAKRERLFAEMRRLIEARPGGRIRKHQLTILHVAKKKINAASRNPAAGG